jgi:hypothetical protein
MGEVAAKFNAVRPAKKPKFTAGSYQTDEAETEVVVNLVVRDFHPGSKSLPAVVNPQEIVVKRTSK